MTQKENELRNAFKLMRIPFSVFLMPIFWFALSNALSIDITIAVFVFIILHLLVYPASNGYNSFYDKDTSSIGGLKDPPPPNKKLLIMVYFFDLFAILASAYFVSYLFAIMVATYLLISKAYSYDKIRLKKNPVAATIVVTVFQGAFIYSAVKIALNDFNQIDYVYAFVSTLFLAGSYPLTQIYQHEEDKKRNDITLSFILGIKGTFLFAKIFIAAGSVLLLLLYFYENRFAAVLIFILSTIPVLLYFNRWERRARKNSNEANFENTMRMNKVSSLCLSAAFILIMIFGNARLF